MPNCSVATCTSHNKMKGATDIKFYGFPKNKDLAIQWAQACKRSDKINMKYATICSKHFESKCFFIPMKYKLLNEMPPKYFRNLHQDAIPTLFLPQNNMPEGSAPTSKISTSSQQMEKTDAFEKRQAISHYPKNHNCDTIVKEASTCEPSFVTTRDTEKVLSF